MRVMNLFFATFAAAALVSNAGCAPPCPVCLPAGWAPLPMPMYLPPPPPPVVATPAPAPAPMPVTPPGERPKVAVLPIEDDELFRAERAELRASLAARITTLTSAYVVLPLEEVDAKLRPISAKTGAACAFAWEPSERRAREQGWDTTNIIHVAGFRSQPEELWIQVLEYNQSAAVEWTAPWDPKLGLVDRYRSAFAALKAQGAGVGGILGGLGVGGIATNEVTEGAIRVCEEKNFVMCDPASGAWKDKASELAACFAGEDEGTIELIVQSDEAQPRCEMVNLNDPSGHEGAREACLCKALGASAAMRAKPGRRSLRVRYEAPDLAKKARPELRVVDVTNNLDSEAAYHSIKTERDGKAVYSSVQRLVVDNVDGLAAPLARCGMPAGSVVVADVDVREDGGVGGARLLTNVPKKDAACLEKAIGRGAFTCTDDGKAAKLRISIAWPEAVK